MKLVKMSMVAALLVGSSAFAIENTKVSGDAKLFYSTSDAKNGTANILAGETGSGSLFAKDSSAADAAFNLNVTTDLVSNDLVKISAGAGYTVLTTLGLENNLVSNVWGGSHSATQNTNQSYGGSSHSNALGGAKVENANWFKEAWIAATAGKTTAKLGRMELDTPLAYSEKWSAEVNTFEGIVAINQDIPDTTVVGAYLGNGNGNEEFGTDALSGDVTALGLAAGPIVNAEGKFGTFGSDGAYALGVVNNSFKPLTVQAWYYELPRLLNAYWLQADLNMEGILAGVQYSAHDVETDGSKVGFLGANPGDSVKTDSSVVAAMLGYEMKDVVTVKVAYSQVDDKFAAGFNVATSTGNSKLYTQTFWNYSLGYGATAADTDTMKFSVSSPVNGLFDVCASYTSVDQGTSGMGTNNDLDEIALVVKKSFGPLDAKLAYINVDQKNKDTYAVKGFDDKYNMVQAYLTLNF
ncbi:MAG: hypothetical protein RBR54_03655 [Sulfurimonas sp.]|jgi:hypothetical protein|nr:hypothetical protein [Sulfurimonas sp.]